MCGDYTGTKNDKDEEVDTTPRVRGLPGPRINKAGQRRYNPACAGTTKAAYILWRRDQIQPRVCGDYAQAGWLQEMRYDTTPRVRGLPGSTSCTGRITRYNPACAGTTRRSRSRQISSSIQPRVCGDYGMITAWPTLAADTTPRVRGLPCDGLACRYTVRYNPACAGTTRSPTIYSCSVSIQPRVCGDYGACRGEYVLSPDTTPRVRGLRQSALQLLDLFRYNPACAGTTWPQ